jgi:type IV pilus assembly protein PilE
MNKSRFYGFTLIEVMITVVIIGVLAAIAYPSYTKYMKQTRRSDAQIALTEIASREEKYLAQCNNYTATPNSGTISACSGLGYSALSPGGHYALSIANGSINGSCSGASAAISCGYTAKADPNTVGTTGQQKNDGALQIDSTGLKQWNQNNSGTWVNNWTTH